tara:strand:- start:930 stop:4349 length:3420 start_codon:yes stop_codon:yes gene_type:complete
MFSCNFTRKVLPSFIIGLSTFLCFSLYGQEDEGKNDEENKIYELSPFVLDASADKGYLSTNATSATSLNTAIKDIPMAIEVVNAAFMEDRGATNFEEALAYSSGVVMDDFRPSQGFSRDGSNTPGANEVSMRDPSPSSRGGLGGRFDNATNIRGFNVPFQNRDGFRYGGLIAQHGIILGGIVDTSNVERMEVVRGPNSLLYGIGVLSGIVNIIPKRPLSANVEKASVAAGNYGFRRATLDVTGPISKDFLGGQLNYRVASTFEERGNWRDWVEKDLEVYVGQLEWQTEKVSLLLEGQYADQQENGVSARHVHDNLSAAFDPQFRNEFYEQFNWTKDWGGKPESYNITGPDTYHWRREDNFLANLDITPIENLTISAGMFLTNAKEEEFNLDIATLVNEERSLDVKGVLIPRPDDPNTKNPEAIRSWLSENVTLFENSHMEWARLPGDKRNLRDYRTVRYWWEQIPKDTTTEQYRIRMAYNFESRLFNTDSKHAFLIGRHDIKDTADYLQGSERISWTYANKLELSEDDPLQMRNINDHSVIRYNGEPLAMPGLHYRHTEVWFSGHYALYHGQLLDNKLGLILGARHDRFHSRDRIYDRFDEIDFYGPNYDGPPLELPPSEGVANNPQNDTFGFFPLPEGISEYLPNAEEAEKTTTKTIALNYKVFEDLVVYGVRAEGLTPNTGVRDGNLVGIPSEQTLSEELGIKFDFWDAKLSGTISAYRIERENALWNLSHAPAPAEWVGGIDALEDEANDDTGFDPAAVKGGFPISYGLAKNYFYEEGVELGKNLVYTRDENGKITGRKKEWPVGLLGEHGGGGTNVITNVFLEYSKLDLPAIDKDGNPTGKTWRHYLEKAFADRSRSAAAFSNYHAGPDNYDPVMYGRIRGETFGLNPSSPNSRGTNVTYTDEATGYDLQLIYSATNNWQVILTYAHTEREAITPFKLVDAYDPDNDQTFGTEYDVWVRTFGREAFGLDESDTDGDGVIDMVTKDGQAISVGDVSPTSLRGGLQGISLYSGPEDSASLWTKYQIDVGVLTGLDLGLGVIYTGPAQTSIPIGGSDLAENLYGTPPTKERYRVDLGFNYRWRINDSQLRLRLNVYNLMDDQKGQSIIFYKDNGLLLPRRSDVYYAPRSYRLSVGLDF